MKRSNRNRLFSVDHDKESLSQCKLVPEVKPTWIRNSKCVFFSGDMGQNAVVAAMASRHQTSYEKLEKRCSISTVSHASCVENSCPRAKSFTYWTTTSLYVKRIISPGRRRHSIVSFLSPIYYL